MQGARAAHVRQTDLRGVQQPRLLSAREPLPVALADELIDAAAREVAGAHARDAGGDVEAQLAASKVAPGGNQDLVRHELLQLAREPEIDVLMPADEGGARNDAEKPRA